MTDYSNWVSERDRNAISWSHIASAITGVNPKTAFQQTDDSPPRVETTQTMRAAAQSVQLVFSPASPDGFNWPGGTFDAGETPSGKVQAIGVYTADGSLIADLTGLSVEFSAIVKVTKPAALEALLFSKSDDINLYAANETINSWGGNDHVTLWTGGGTVHGGAGSDTLAAASGVKSGVTALYGDDGNDTLFGSTAYYANGHYSAKGGEDHLYGGAGRDTIYGFNGDDILMGGGGNDRLVGGQFSGGGWVDKLTGGAGEDTFVFSFYSKAGKAQSFDSGLRAGQRDLITDFQHGSDTIEIHSALNTHLKFVATNSFSGTNQVRYDKTSDGVTAFFNVDSDLKADFAIDIHGVHKLTGGDFDL